MAHMYEFMLAKIEQASKSWKLSVSHMISDLDALFGVVILSTQMRRCRWINAEVHIWFSLRAIRLLNSDFVFCIHTISNLNGTRLQGPAINAIFTLKPDRMLGQMLHLGSSVHERFYQLSEHRRMSASNVKSGEV